jgi:predicted site-specific integrase-resolvase
LVLKRRPRVYHGPMKTLLTLVRRFGIAVFNRLSGAEERDALLRHIERFERRANARLEAIEARIDTQAVDTSPDRKEA